MKPQNHDGAATEFSDVGLSSRLAALEIIQGVLDKKRDLDTAIQTAITYTRVDADAQAYAVFLARATLKQLGQLDHTIDRSLERPLPRKARDVRHILRLGLVQLLFSQTAEHAAISTSVELCRAIRQEGLAKLVNAILRRAQREQKVKSVAQDEARLNTPDWIWYPCVAAYGEAETRRIADAHLGRAPLDLTPKSDAQGWAARLGGEVVLDGTVRLRVPRPVKDLEGFDTGDWWVQDAAARLPVALLGDVAGKSVVDLCAAPGGKTMALCAGGAQVTALDISEKRLTRVQENLHRTGLQADLVCADARTWLPDAPVDIVLLDAPCSASGTLRRHPDVAWLKSQQDVDKLTGIQDALLDHAIKMLKPGGILLFATCSLLPAESENRAKAFLKRHPTFQIDRTDAAHIGGLSKAITAEGHLRTLPHHLAEHGGMDGFFAARFSQAL